MLKRLLIISLVCVFAPLLHAGAQDQKAAVKGPITITSETLTADNRAHTALFERKVVAKTTDMTIQSDKMLVSYSETGGEVTKIEAIGNVRVLREARIITSNEATYFAEEEKVVFTGEPRAMDGDNIVTGSKIVYFTAADRFTVDNSKVVLKSRKDR